MRCWYIEIKHKNCKSCNYKFVAPHRFGGMRAAYCPLCSSRVNL